MSYWGIKHKEWLTDFPGGGLGYQLLTAQWGTDSATNPDLEE